MFGLGRGEMILSGIIVVLIFGWTLVPRIGEKIGGLFEKR
jgi:hypothetical protein